MFTWSISHRFEISHRSEFQIDLNCYIVSFENSLLNSVLFTWVSNNPAGDTRIALNVHVDLGNRFEIVLEVRSSLLIHIFIVRLLLLPVGAKIIHEVRVIYINYEKICPSSHSNLLIQLWSTFMMERQR